MAEDQARELLESNASLAGWPRFARIAKIIRKKKITKLQPKEGSKTRKRALYLRSMS